MKQLPMLSTADKLAEIRRLYFKATRQTIQADLAKALDLLKSMGTENAIRLGLEQREETKGESLAFT